MTSPLLDQYRYTISDIKLIDPPAASFPWHKPIFLIEIAKVTGNDHERLESVVGNGKNNQIVWSEQILYNITTESTITFKIHKKTERTNELEILIGEYTNTVSGLLYIQISCGICKVALGQGSQLSFTIKEDRFKNMLDKAKQQSEGIYFTPGVSWSTFLTYFGIVKTAVDSVASLNPYAKQVWSIVSIVPNIFQMHATRNSNVQKLLERLVDIYKYINEADRLSALTNTQSEKLKLLIDTTCECVDFIKKYTKNSAATNLIKGPSFDNRISKFKESFDQIFKTIEDSLILKIGIATSNIEDLKLLGDIPYADNVGLDHEKICLPGTRQKLIREIVEWVYQEDTSERVLLLSGQAGTGKSAVAHTTAKTLSDRLGSFFRFNRNNKGKINLLFSTISRDLADGDVSWRRNLVQAIGKTAIRKSLDPITQFNEMVIKSSNGTETKRRVVIIIDALDESGDQKERGILLNLLFKRSSELPSNYRIIITSRPEHDIGQFHQHSNVCCKYMADIDSNDTLDDIQQFISVELCTVAKVLDVVDKDWHLLLARKAQSLFQWAKVACVYILELELEAAQRLRTILSKSTSSLYEMYHQILDAQPDCRFDSYLTLLKTCVGAVIVSRKPLSVSALQAFFGPICGDGKDVKVVLKSLNSLFIGIDKSTPDVRPIHTSLFDFFLDPEQKPGTPNRYYIDTSDQSSFTYGCLRVMNDMLRFNICGLETSHLRNRDVTDFGSRVAKSIPFHLSYACCFWAYHLEYSSINTDLLENIYDLMCNKLLYFFEVLGLLGEVDHGRSGMQILISKIRDKNSELAARAAEASQFAFEFGRIMMESTPHLYLSSLPYISNGSFMSQQFLPQYPQLLSMDIGQPIALQPEIKDSIWQRHPSARPSAAAFSPQGRRIATGFSNGDLWVWDYVTGEIVTKVGPKEKPPAVWNVVFSLNGELVYCCFKDGSILTWEAKTNKVLYESNEGLAPRQCDDCTISANGCYIGFIASDHTLSFYERETRSKLFEDRSDSEYSCIMMFSPSGSLFGFWGGDWGVRLWDTQKQTFVSPFGSTTKSWTLEALSDNYIITYVNDSPMTREIWDIQTRTMVRRFDIESIFGKFIFSPNGEYLLRTEGNKRWIWTISTGEITQRFVEHSSKDIIFLTALSPDSKHIAFSTLTRTSAADTIHVLAWDALVQEETEDLSKDIREEREVYYDRTEAWLKGQYLLFKLKDTTSIYGYLQVFDTTRMTGLKPDFQVVFSNWQLVEISPEDNHWSIAYISLSQADLLHLWNIDEKEEFILHRSDGKVVALAFSATGDRLISGDSWGNIKIWHVRTHQLISRGGLSEAATALTFSPMGTTFWVAYAKDGHTFIEEWECSESQNIINGPFTHDSTNRSICLFSNNAYIYVCAADAHVNGSDPCYIRLDRSTGASIGCFNTPQPARFSPNRRYIAWMPEKDRKKVKLSGYLEKGVALNGFLLTFHGVVTEFVFSTDSKRIGILSGVGGMKCVHIWDIETKGLVIQLFFSEFESERSSGSRMAFNDSLLWVGTSNMGRMWDLHVDEIITRAHDDDMDNSQSGMLPRHLQTRQLIHDYKTRSENTEVLDYALAAWKKASFLPWTMLVDGWMLGPHGELLFWIPQKMRSGLLYPSMSLTTYEKSTKLDFDKFVHGTRWTECKVTPKTDHACDTFVRACKYLVE